MRGGEDLRLELEAGAPLWARWRWAGFAPAGPGHRDPASPVVDDATLGQSLNHGKRSQRGGCCYAAAVCPRGAGETVHTGVLGTRTSGPQWEQHAGWCPRKCEHLSPPLCQAPPVDLGASPLPDLIPGLPASHEVPDAELQAVATGHAGASFLCQGVAGYILPVPMRKRPPQNRPHVTSLTESTEC